MSLSPAAQELRDRYFQALLDVTAPLQNGPDPEIALEALIEAVHMLRERLEQELQELREESAE
jgi:hypothetical protein